MFLNSCAWWPPCRRHGSGKLVVPPSAQSRRRRCGHSTGHQVGVGSVRASVAVVRFDQPRHARARASVKSSRVWPDYRTCGAVQAKGFLFITKKRWSQFTRCSEFFWIRKSVKLARHYSKCAARHFSLTYCSRKSLLWWMVDWRRAGYILQYVLVPPCWVVDKRRISCNAIWLTFPSLFLLSMRKRVGQRERELREVDSLKKRDSRCSIRNRAQQAMAKWVKLTMKLILFLIEPKGGQTRKTPSNCDSPKLLDHYRTGPIVDWLQIANGPVWCLNTLNAPSTWSPVS